MAGRRVQYLHPVKMYIFISLVYFVLLFSYSSEQELVKVGGDRQPSTTEVVGAAKVSEESPLLTPEQKREILLNLNQLQSVKDENADTAIFRNITIETLKDGKRDTTYLFDNFTVKKGKKGGLDTTYTYNSLSDLFATSNNDTSYQQYLRNQQKIPANKRDNFLERYINKKIYAGKEKGAENAQKIIVEAVKHNAPKMMFLLLPLFALMLKMAFYKNKKFYVEHLIFSFHLHCFLFLFLTIIILIKIPIPDSWKSVDRALNIASFFAVTYYVYRALKVVYKRTRSRTITKMAGLTFSYLIVFALSLGVLFLMSALFAF